MPGTVWTLGGGNPGCDFRHPIDGRRVLERADLVKP